jgi:hypothetical protein
MVSLLGILEKESPTLLLEDGALKVSFLGMAMPPPMPTPSRMAMPPPPAIVVGRRVDC